MTVYVGLDTATVCGVAIYYPKTNEAVATEIKGTPIQQKDAITKLVDGIGSLFFCMEKQHVFVNAVTIRSLLERYGYLRWSLLEMGYEVVEVSPRPARALLNCKTKKDVFMKMVPHFKGTHLTSNHCDALAVALWVAESFGAFSEEKGLPTILVGEQ